MSLFSSLSTDIEEGVFTPTPKDQQLEVWCDTVSIDRRAGIQVLTTPVSVGSRNMFKTQHTLQYGDVVLRIPESIVFHPKNAAAYFPAITTHLFATTRFLQKRRNNTRRSKLGEGEDIVCGFWNRFTNYRNRRRNLLVPTDSTTTMHDDAAEENSNDDDDEDAWRRVLAAYALASLASSATKNPWYDWIQQWHSEDPVHNFFLRRTRRSKS